MTIDVQPGDTFNITCYGLAYQWRGHLKRCLGESRFTLNSNPEPDRDITLADFRRIAELAGHTVTEVVPEPEPVVVTHGIEHPSRPGVFSFVGTKEAITKFAKERKDNAVPIIFGRTATC